MAKATKSKDDAKKTCVVTRAEFRTNSPTPSSVMTKLADDLSLEVKEFSSGGFGYGSYGKMNVKIGDKVVKCQVTLSIIVVNSKFAEDGTSVEPPAVGEESKIAS